MPEVTPVQKVLPRYLLAIDPSINNLGYAIFSKGGALIHAGFLQQEADRSLDYRARSLAMAQGVERLLDLSTEGDVLAPHFQSVDLLIETPENWFGGRGMASKDDEAVQKLYLLVGTVIGTMAASLVVGSIWGAFPTAWKGQTPKDIMKSRAIRYAGTQGINLPPSVPHDTCEAILLGKKGYEAFVGGKRVDPPFDPPTIHDYEHPFINIFCRGGIPVGTFSQEDFVDTDTPSGD